MTDVALTRARDRVRRLHRARSLRAAVLQQIQAVEQGLAELERQFASETDDVARLEGRTLTALIARMRGTTDERLAKERAEADAAWLRVEGHQARHAQLAGDLTSVEQELIELASAPSEYQQAMTAAEQELIAAGDPRGTELAEVAVRLADAEADAREHAEACQAGRDALGQVGIVLRYLGGARTASTFDMFSGSMIADMAEHDRLSYAAAAAWTAQQALDRFAQELADVGANVRLELPEIDTSWFIDTFFDNILVDAMRHSRIARTGDEVAEVATWVQQTVDRLAKTQQELAQLRADLFARREHLHGLR
jgi:chromosome segregation ATPase